MKAAIVLCFVALAAVALARPDEKYTSRYDNINLDEILANPKILENYVNCILDKGKCTTEGKELKSHMEDAMKTECSKCTDAQKRGTEKVMEHLINKEQSTWRDLKAKFDPDNKYAPSYEKRLGKKA